MPSVPLRDTSQRKVPLTCNVCLAQKTLLVLAAIALNASSTAALSWAEQAQALTLTHSGPVGCLFQLLFALMVTNLPLISSLHFFLSALALFAPVPVSSFSFSGSSLLLAPLMYLWTAIRSPLSRCHAGLNKPSSFSLLSPEVIRTSGTEVVQLICFCSQVRAQLGWVHATLALMPW